LYDSNQYLQRTKENIGNKFSTRSGSQVDRDTIVPGVMDAQVFGHVDFDDFDATEFEPPKSCMETGVVRLD
jgi:hypothetical protein